MNYTTFNTENWNLSTFNKIGYDRKNATLHIYYFNGDVLEFQNIAEKDVFELIIAIDKPAFIDELKAKYDLIVHPRSSLA
ncbi:MAG: KTSC domain-containing protein [Bacillaceae bacterium]|nr:KTSC domain-containing protein [Bacillaceae bacterium]